MAADKFEFRSVTAEEMPQFRRLGSYVFANNAPSSDNGPMLAEWTHTAFHQGRLVASSGAFPFKIRMNGRGVAASGVTGVGTEPGYRRRGLVRRLIGDLLRRAHEHGQPVSILWASMGAIYQRFGYGLASTYAEYSFDPRFTQFQFGEGATGETRILDKDAAVPVVSKLYREFIDTRNLPLHRAPILWELPFRDTRDTPGGGPAPYCAVHYNGDDQPDGYMLYTIAQSSGMTVIDQKMAISDFVWRDMNGYRGLWEFIRGHDLVGRVTAMPAADDPASLLLLEPRVLNRRTSDGLWLRVVDVAAALAARGYQHAGEATIEIAADPECPWNEGVYRFATDAVQAQAEKTRGGGEVRITIQGLASLLCGRANLTQLTRVGRAEVADDKRLPALDALFSTRYQPHCLNHF